MRASRMLAAAVMLFVLGGCGGRGSQTGADVPNVGPQPYAAKIDALANQQVGNGLVASLEVGIFRRGQTVFDRAYGWRSLTPAVAADTSTVYQIASLTKAFTAASILLLAQDGKLGLDDSLARYIPEYPPASQITLRQMLTMVSGIPSAPNDAFTTLYGAIDHESVVLRLAMFPLDFAPGSRFEYANANYYFLGLVIERVSKMTYPAFVSTRILTPLGLTRTAYLADWSGSDTAAGYFHNGSAGAPLQLHPSWSADYLFSMGGLVSNAPDLLRWDESLRSAGLLNAASLTAMFTVPNPVISAYAMGWFIDPDGTRYHDGESGGFNTAQAIFSDGYDIVVLGNTWDQYSGAFNPLALLQAVHAQLPP